MKNRIKEKKINISIYIIVFIIALIIVYFCGQHIGGSIGKFIYNLQH